MGNSSPMTNRQHYQQLNTTNLGILVGGSLKCKQKMKSQKDFQVESTGFSFICEV